MSDPLVDYIENAKAEHAAVTAPAPIEANPTPLPDQLAAAGRVLTILVAGFTTIVGFLSQHDLIAAFAWIRSTDGAPFVSAVVMVGTFVWGQYKTRKRAKQLATVAASPEVPAHIATLKGQ